MSRRRAPTGLEISLFPFLAVLLCTMGSLLVLLVIFSRSAAESEDQAAAEAARQREEDLALARDDLAWRLEQLTGVRDRTAAELARARMHLAGIEDDARATVDEIESLERTAAALERPDDGDDESIRDLESRLAAARQAVEAARAGAADRPPAYAVVPYEGPSGTHRRPLYIECCIDGVFLQPEGIRLGPADFEGPPGPGNPLASGLRAAREHLAGRPGESGDPDTQPYPLLLVRPSGVMAYYAAREALQSWGSDFGYQFIDEDWTLSFPPADPVLAEVEMRAVEEARRRLEWLAQVRPRPRSKPAVQYRAATTRGGVVATGGPSVLGDQSRWDWTEQQAAAGRGFRADGGEGEAAGRGDAILGDGDGGGDGDSPWAAGGEPASPAEPGLGNRYRGPSKFYGGSGEGASGAGAAAVTDGPAGTASAPAEEDTRLAAGEAAGRAGESGGTSGTTGDATDLDHAPGGQAGGRGAGAKAGIGSGGGGGFGPSLPGMAGGRPAGEAGAAAGPGAAECSLAGRRGSNWASLASTDRPIPLTRPIRLECSADEFRILGGGGRVTARVPIGTRTADSVDSLVQEVHATVGGWGMAGDRMYWKPELVLSATADGTGRRDDLERLLADSGLDTRRAGESDAVRSLPPVRRADGTSLTR